MERRNDIPLVSQGAITSVLGTSSHAGTTVLTSEAILSPHVPSAGDSFEDLFNSIDPDVIEAFFCDGEDSLKHRSELTTRIKKFMLRMVESGPLREALDLAIVDSPTNGDSITPAAHNKVNTFMEAERRVQMAYRIHKHSFPSPIWHCCRNLCFAKIATDPLQFMLFEELILIQDYSERCHKSVEKAALYVQQRRKGIGSSTVAFSAPSREEREANNSEEHYGTEREKALREFAKFVVEVLPFLYGQVDSPRGTMRPKRKLCTQAICCLLGVSRNFLYNRKSMLSPGSLLDKELTSLVDTAGLRLRQHRRNSDRATTLQLTAYKHTNVGATCRALSTSHNGPS